MTAPSTPRIPVSLKIAALLMSAAILLLAVGLIVYLVNLQSDDATKGKRADEFAAFAIAQNQEFAADRATLLHDQHLVLGYAETLVERQDALLAYLRTHGVAIPATLAQAIPAPHLTTLPSRSGGGAGQNQNGSSTQHRGGQKAPKTPKHGK